MIRLVNAIYQLISRSPSTLTRQYHVYVRLYKASPIDMAFWFESLAPA